MALELSFHKNSHWHQEAEKYLVQSDYHKVTNLYEQAIEAEPDIKSHYWHLGLALLLQGQEAEAQTTWLIAMVDGEPAQVEQWTRELMQVLEKEAERRSVMADTSTAWLLRQHMREIQPTDINNLLYFTQLAIKLETLTNDELEALNLVSLLSADVPGNFDADLLLQVFRDVLNYVPLFPVSLAFAEACIPHLPPLEMLRILLRASVTVAYSMQQPVQGSRLAELCFAIAPRNAEVLRHLAACYQNSGEHSKGIEVAKQYYSLTRSVHDQVLANHMVLRGLMHAGGYWEEAIAAFEQHESLLLSLIAEQPNLVGEPHICRLLTSTFFFPYWRDEPLANRGLQNQVAELFQSSLQNTARELQEKYSQQLTSKKSVVHRTKRLKIGYLSAYLKRHSVGWLARWLFEHHDRDRFEIHGYFVSYKETNHPLQEWYVNQVEQAHTLGINSGEIAEQIYQDDIDILVDLDSITLDISCEVMAIKPAPIQVTWLGWDATGIPAIDYYIADPYVLPESAQNYYKEKIWRLPETYIAVDGFEIGVPSLRREHLDIPDDAVVYLSAQGNYKRHPDTIKLQMKILKEVPNSFFLIKGFADEEAVIDFFIQIAQAEGVSADRLRFLPDVPLEAVHRANLRIADVVLDTYPYNGATTTLETLWMGVPLVTRVGQQFAARNSYTMMMNAGITEGIAWTDEEYIDWGVRLGKDSALRQKITWQLWQSRRTAPLWNGKRFTQQMEKAYEEMWANYMTPFPV
ncbi:MAG: O-linked N-acetylglucosamine transferase, SPINDLY family protein [Scytonema sp. PMC 1069.18]|nr:O-linked N-acetylglucosamine transferase, SPINDLY family protein [Scytonema sp. PMC 1069.18]MEC4880613.1 O-linked N-acetylglucosamine transferase, SPINDLY family protein [Scytonema sp. PMC 1070.18]